MSYCRDVLVSIREKTGQAQYLSEAIIENLERRLSIACLRISAIRPYIQETVSYCQIYYFSTAIRRLILACQYRYLPGLRRATAPVDVPRGRGLLPLPRPIPLPCHFG